MIIDGQIPILQMDMTSQTKTIDIKDININENCTLIRGMEIDFTPQCIDSRIVVQCSGNLTYTTPYGFSSMYLTCEAHNEEKVLTKLGPIQELHHLNRDLRFDNLSMNFTLQGDIHDLDNLIFRVRANGINDKDNKELTSYNFWYLQVQEFKF